MKKTFVTALMALASVASAAEPTDFVYSTSFTSNGQDVANGFIIKLSDSFVSTTTPNELTEFDLKSVTLQASAAGGAFANEVRMAVFLRPGADQVGTFVGLSDNTVTFATNTPLTFTFSDTEISKNSQYQYFFVQPTTLSSQFSKTENNGTQYNEAKAQFRFDRGNTGGNLPTGDGVTWGPFSGWSGQNMALVSFTVSDPNAPVPEPTTGTLSLLALAGLCARRRKK